MADFYFLGNSSHGQMLGCVIKTETKTLVIDGGSCNDYSQLADFLREKANSRVDAWFFTHPHHDHIGAFCNIRKNNIHITVGTIYHRFPTIEELCDYEVRSEQEKELWKDVNEWASEYDVHKLSKGESFSFDDVTVSVLRVYNPNIKKNFVNNSSAVFNIKGKLHDILILGDLGVEGGEELMRTCPLNSLACDYTQMAHHGQNGVSKEFYQYIKPKRCLWPAPEWLWNNDRGNGFDTGPYNTVRTREWIAEIGATEHLVEKDGTQKFEF